MKRNMVESACSSAPPAYRNAASNQAANQKGDCHLSFASTRLQRGTQSLHGDKFESILDPTSNWKALESCLDSAGILWGDAWGLYVNGNQIFWKAPVWRRPGAITFANLGKVKAASHPESGASQKMILTHHIRMSHDGVCC